MRGRHSSWALSPIQANCGEGATRSLFDPCPQFDLPVRRQKAPCSHAGIVAEAVSKNPCGQRMTSAFRREIARKPGRGVARQFKE
jgi:hypothetical protein